MTVENVVATTSDMINNVIYWSDMESKKIMKMKRGESAQPLIEVNKFCKIRRLTRPLLAIRQKLAASENICVWTYEKRPQVIRLDLKSNTYILDDYDDY